jgi:SecD/SecF fusion protein
MKRIAISILIGAGFCLLALGFIKLRENRIQGIKPDDPLFNGELKIKIGKGNDNNNLIKTTIDQIRNRIDYNIVSTQQIDKNTFQISAKKIHDTVTFKKLLTASEGIEFTEVFILNDIQNSIVTAEEELTNRRKKYLETSTPDTSLLSAQIEVAELAKKNGYGKLVELISFFQPYQESNGKIFFPASLGSIKKRDTVYLNKIFRDQEIMRNFPASLKFAYGDHDKSLPGNDSLLALYALKIVDQSFNRNPTGNQIIDAELDFEPATGHSYIMFAFNARGSEAWYRMTERNIGRPIAILINDFVLSAPVVESAIEGGKARITGDFTIDEAMYIRTIMRSGKLNLTVKITEQRFSPSKKSKKTIWILTSVFLFISALSYGVSFLIKPASKS